jgi:cysteinyl-tRNA synthetase
MDALNCLRADRYPKATDVIPDIIHVVEGLIAKGYAYAVGNNVYYRVARFPAYGRLSMRGAAPADPLAERPEAVPKEDATALGREEHDLVSLAADAIDEMEPAAQKQDPRDFALWKGARPGEPSWDSPPWSRTAGLAHRVHDDDLPDTRPADRHPRRRPGPDLPAPRKRDRAKRGL